MADVDDGVVGLLGLLLSVGQTGGLGEGHETVAEGEAGAAGAGAEPLGDLGELEGGASLRLRGRRHPRQVAEVCAREGVCELEGSSGF